MKHLVLIIYLVFGLTNISENSELSPKVLKSINKEIKRIWKGITVTRTPFTINNEMTKGLMLETDNSSILYNGNDTLGYLFVRKTNGCLIGGCTNSTESIIDTPLSNNFAERYENFDYMVILNADLSIKKVKVLVYEGEYGYEIASKLWLKQFIGYFGGDLKYGTDIQAISGATVSAQSITDDIQLLVQSVKELRVLGGI